MVWPATVHMEIVSTYPILDSMLLSRPILTPTYCSVFIVTVVFLLLTWSITLFAGGGDGGKEASRNLVDSERKAAVEACKDQCGLELKEHTLELFHNDLAVLSNIAATHNEGVGQDEVTARVRSQILDLEAEIEQSKIEQKQNAW